jgi:hypothetical protein
MTKTVNQRLDEVTSFGLEIAMLIDRRTSGPADAALALAVAMARILSDLPPARQAEIKEVFSDMTEAMQAVVSRLLSERTFVQ